MNKQITETWHQEAVAFLRENKGRLRAISSETELGYEWLLRLSRGQYSDPGVNKIQRIINYKNESDK